MEQLQLFDFMSEEDAKRLRPIKSTDWKWSFKDYPKETNGLKVFSCFACGGGSTMGYKLAGCEVLGCVEIDPKMNEVYVKNHKPKYNFLMDIRDFNNIPNEELPPELFDLDILDGSPPCTTFSMAGDREDSWGKKKTCFSDKIVWESDVLFTIVANTNVFRGEEKERISSVDIIHSQTFPEDYDFGTENIGYVCGMSVPPLMIKRIVTRLIESGLFERRE